MILTKEQYVKVKKFIETNLKILTEEQIKLVSSLLEFEIDQVEARVNTNNSAWFSWQRLTAINNLSQADQKIYEVVLKLIELKKRKQQLNENLEELNQYEIISEKVKEFYDKNEAKF